MVQPIWLYTSAIKISSTSTPLRIGKVHVDSLVGYRVTGIGQRENLISGVSEGIFFWRDWIFISDWSFFRGNWIQKISWIFEGRGRRVLKFSEWWFWVLLCCWWFDGRFVLSRLKVTAVSSLSGSLWAIDWWSLSSESRKIKNLLSPLCIGEDRWW